MARILIIDDDPGLRALLSAIFSDLKHEVLEAPAGIEGLESAQSNHPDIVIVDVDMPGMNGHQVCSRLRQMSSTRRLPILMLTGMSQLPQAMQGLASGADDYITKPFDIHEVAARVEALLRRKA